MEDYGEFLIYQSEEGLINIEVKIQDETVWLTQQQMADLFQTSRTNVVEHIKHIYEEGELDEGPTCRKFRQVRKEGNREVSRELPFYNLDMIISLGYRVKSKIATNFRRWATERLKEYMIKGFTMDDERLKNLGGGNYWKELLDRIRDIRSSEKVMGLKSFSGDFPVLKDISIAKNYLNDEELKILNNIVSGYFDFAEIQAMRHNPMYMSDYVEHLDKVLKTTGEKVLQGAGSISHAQAIEKATEEYKKYQVQNLSPVEEEYLESIKNIHSTVKKNGKK